MVEFKSLSKVYNKTKKAVDDLNLTVEDGQIIGFIGPNGAGKTTTIKMLTGIVGPTTGDVIINGFSITKNPIEAKKQFGFVPDNPDMYLRLKGIEYLNFMADVYQVDARLRVSRINELAKKFSLEQALNDKISSYSHGMRQKIVIMGALIHDPYLWILDEPMTGLDPQSAFELKEMMREHAQKGKIVFFSTHVLEVAEKLCDEVIIINHGNMLFDGTLEALKEQHKEYQTLEEIFLGITKNV